MNSKDYSASRYTEARLSPLATSFFDTIEMGTISPEGWEETYDGEGLFPKVLPTLGFYNICNGSFGSIAPTLVSSVPQFNLRDINAAIVALIADPDAAVRILPDFASGGTLLNPETTVSSLSRGEGKSALLRGACTRGKDETGGFVCVTELPYGVYTNTVCRELEKAIDSGKSPIDKFKDLSKKTVNMRVYGKNLDEVEKWLYKETSVQKHFTIKMIMLDKGKKPKLFSLREALLAHIVHAKEVLRKTYEYELNKLKLREEVLRGLIRAQSIIDTIIAMIKASDGRQKAIYTLTTEEWGFTTLQAEAIVDLRLHRLSTIDVAKLSTELDANLLDQDDLVDLLANAQRFNEKLIGFYEEVAKRFGDNRRTKIYAGTEFETAQDGAKMDSNFYLHFSPDDYCVSTGYDDFEDRKPVFIQPDDEVIIITSDGRAFSRKAAVFAAGENQKWSAMLKLNSGETVIFISCAIVMEESEEITLVLASDAKRILHKSTVLLSASQRGKKLYPGKSITKEVRLA